MYNPFMKRQTPPVPQPRPIQQKDGCKIKVRRDSNGRISSIESNGACTKSEIDVFRENLGLKNSEDSDD